MYKYYMPTRIIGEKGASSHLGSILNDYNKSNILVVTDKGIVKAGLLDNLKASLDSSNIQYSIYDEVEPNPKTSTISRGKTKFLIDNNFDAIVSIGGGSSIDAAKALAIIATNPGGILDYEGVGKLKNDPLFNVAIPTTAGTGSEVTNSTVITDERTLFKAAVISEKIFPNIAILDAYLTVNCPKAITSSTGMDALTHAIESYTSKESNPVSDSLALRAIRLITENIEGCYFDGKNVEQREKMLEASMLAALAFSQTRLGNVHAISQAFGGVFDIPHGVANATLLPYVLEFNKTSCLDKFSDIAEAMNIDNTSENKEEIANKVIKQIISWNEKFEIPKNVNELGVKLDKLDQLIRDSMRSGNIKVNPRETNEVDVKNIIINAYEGKI